MSKLTTDEERTKYAKESEIIKYSTNILEEKDGREKPKIVLKELTNEKNRVWTIIFKFKTLDNISQEVIMGTLDDTPERKEKAIEIINLIRGQLEENLIAKEGYKNYEELSSYVKSENIPFILTPEGTNILSCKSKDVVEIKRTYKENDNGEIVSLYEKEDIDQMKTNQNAELNEYIKQKRLIQKWEERREKIDKAIEDGKKYEYVLDSTRYFFVDKIYETDFPKITPRAPMGSRMFDLTEVLQIDKLPKTEEIAGLLKQKSWN